MTGPTSVSSDTAPQPLPPEMSDAVVDAWSPVVPPDPPETSVPALFEAQARHRPDAVALVAGERQWTYGLVNALANQLAHRLRDLGVARDARVAVVLPRSAEFVISVLGVLKAGGAYVPLPTSGPEERLRLLLAASGAKVAITAADLPGCVSPEGLVILDLRTESASLAAQPTANPAVRVTADDLAYVMFTSGTTGCPKGVAIPHRGIVRLVRGQHYAEFDVGQRFLLLASTCFDASTFELWGPLLNGATCVVYGLDLLELPALEQLLRQQQVTCLWLTAGLFNQIIDQRPSLLAPVHHVLTGGDALSVAHVRRALELLPGLRLTNGYGPTEATTFSCTYAIRRDESFPHGSVPIGRPLARTCCCILDEHGHPTAPGTPGELNIGGDGLAHGYLNLPELTAEKFVQCTLPCGSGQRCFRTGDIARYLPDGNIEFLGRYDQQVKIRGYRIEFGEVESALETHPDVQACAVVAQERDGRERELRACLVARAGAALSVRALRTWLHARLPHYMHPAQFCLVRSLPLTANGKLDRQALAREPHHTVPLGTEHLPARTRSEQTLASIWQQVLGQPTVGVHDNFFDLGGQSLSAVAVVEQLYQEQGVLLPLSQFFAQPTIAQLARIVDASGQPRGTATNLPAPPAESAVPLFLIAWFLDLSALELAAERHYVLPFPELAVSNDTCCVEYLADNCLRTLRAVRPHGPYRLAGYSLAGLVAYEMARRLESDGESVQLLAIVDAAPATPLERLIPRAVSRLGHVLHLSFRRQLLLGRAGFYLFDLCNASLRRSFWQTVQAVGSDLARLWRVWKCRQRCPAETTVGTGSDLRRDPAAPEPQRAVLGRFWAHRWAHSLYRPTHCRSGITLFTSEELATQRPAPGRGWAQHAANVREYIIPGSHGSCVRLHRPELARAFRACLAELADDTPEDGQQGSEPDGNGHHLERPGSVW